MYSRIPTKHKIYPWVTAFDIRRRFMMLTKYFIEVPECLYCKYLYYTLLHITYCKDALSCLVALQVLRSAPHATMDSVATVCVVGLSFTCTEQKWTE